MDTFYIVENGQTVTVSLQQLQEYQSNPNVRLVEVAPNTFQVLSRLLG